MNDIRFDQADYEQEQERMREDWLHDLDSEQKIAQLENDMSWLDDIVEKEEEEEDTKRIDRLMAISSQWVTNAINKKKRVGILEIHKFDSYPSKVTIERIDLNGNVRSKTHSNITDSSWDRLHQATRDYDFIRTSVRFDSHGGTVFMYTENYR